MSRWITLAISLKTGGKKFITLQVFFVFSTWPVSLSGICGTLLLLVMLLMTTAKKKTLFLLIRVYSCGIAGFTDQQNSF